MQTLPIIDVLADRVILGGTFQTADNKGQHSLVQPQVLLTELQHGKPPQPGDSVNVQDDGSHVHVPKAAAIAAGP